jgi:outer membrane lipoprotein-sorting protein
MFRNSIMRFLRIPSPGFFLLLVFFGTFFRASAADRELDAGEIAALVTRVESSPEFETPRKITFREKRTSPLLRDPVMAEGTLWFAPPNQFRREITKPAPSIVVSDGNMLWLIYPDFAEVEEYELDSRFPLAGEMKVFQAGLGLRDLPRHFRIRAWETHDSTRLELRPRGGGRTGVEKILLTLNDGLSPRRLEIFSRDGSLSVWDILGEEVFSPGEDFFQLPRNPRWRIQRPLDRTQPGS